MNITWINMRYTVLIPVLDALELSLKYRKLHYEVHDNLYYLIRALSCAEAIQIHIFGDSSKILFYYIMLAPSYLHEYKMTLSRLKLKMTKSYLKGFSHNNMRMTRRCILCPFPANWRKYQKNL